MINYKTITKYFIFMTGLFFMGLGISLTTKSDLGTSPISSVPYVLSLLFPLTFGQFTFLLSLLFLSVEIILLGKSFPKDQFFQVLVGPFFGLFVDWGMAICHSLSPHVYAEKLMVLLLGCVVLALGVYLQVAANVIVNPGEGVVKTLTLKTGKKFGDIKIIFDSTLVIVSVMLSLGCFGVINGVREGTLVSAVLVGYITKIFSKLFEYFHLKQIVASYFA